MAQANSPSGVQVSYRQQYRRCGKAACSRCASGGPGHGPYWYAYWWEGGRSRSRYIGTQAPAAVLPVVQETNALDAIPVVQAATTALRVCTLGGFAVWRGETAIGPEQWAGHRAITLFKCLLSVPDRRLSREQAIEVLWPGGDPATCASNLRTTLYLLRQVLDGPDPKTSRLRTDGTMLTLAPAGDAAPPPNWLDAAIFAQTATAALTGQDAAACRAALAWYGGDYLPDDPYEEWAVQPRDTLRRQYLQLLQHLAMLCATRGEQEEAETCLRRVLTAEPSHEDAAATLMGMLAATGRRHEALRVYQALATVLEEELDVAPTAEIMALRTQLLAHEAAPRAVETPVQQIRTVRLTNLPHALTSFVGRAWEMTEITHLLARARLVTLTGPGGAGKTRLALAVADRQVEPYPHGVWLVELAALADPGMLPQAVATALGVVEQANRPVLDTLIDFLRPRRVLLVLDNCEQLIAACAELATTLLRTCPELRLLTTSREGLEVAGEHTYRVPALSTPDPIHPPPPERLQSYEAVQLFLERARTRRPEITLTPANVSAVTKICARLEGMPLAIELAAARVSSLPLEGIAARLEESFRLLTGGPRTALPRQQTLRATLDWSHALLSVRERIVLRRLAIFAGGWTLAGAESICGGNGVEEAEVWDLLSGLVHKSLAFMEDRETEIRYRMLETVRQYGVEKLEEAGESAAIRDHHLDWCIELGELAMPHFRGPQQLVWLDRLEREHDNLRAALQWSTEHPARAEAGLRLAGSLWNFWMRRGYPHEGRRRLEELLTSAPAAPAALRARALHGAECFARLRGDHAQSIAYGYAGVAAYREVGDLSSAARLLINLGWGEQDCEQARVLGEEALSLGREAGSALATALALSLLGCLTIGRNDLAGARIYFEEGLELARASGDRVSLAGLLKNLAEVATYRGNYEHAAALYDECLSLERELGRSVDCMLALQCVGDVAFYRGDIERAMAMLEESMRLSRDLGDRGHRISTLDTMWRIALQKCDYDQATVHIEEGLSLARALGEQHGISAGLAGSGWVALSRGDIARAVALHRESLAIFQDMGLPMGSTARLEGLAIALGAWGQEAISAYLLGAAEAAREGHGTPIPPPDRALYNRSITALRDELGENVLAAAWAEGRGASLEAAVVRALEVAYEGATDRDGTESLEPTIK